MSEPRMFRKEEIACEDGMINIDIHHIIAGFEPKDGSPIYEGIEYYGKTNIAVGERIQVFKFPIEAKSLFEAIEVFEDTFDKSQKQLTEMMNKKEVLTGLPSEEKSIIV